MIPKINALTFYGINTGRETLTLLTLKLQVLQPPGGPLSRGAAWDFGFIGPQHRGQLALGAFVAPQSGALEYPPFGAPPGETQCGAT